MNFRRILEWRLLPHAVAVAATLMLGVLAWRQYTLIGQISDVERDRVRGHLASAVGRFRAEFSDKVTRVFADTGSDFDLDGVAGRLTTWWATSPDSRWVRAVYIATGNPDSAAELSRFDPATHKFISEPWPERLRRLRDRIQEHRMGTPPGDPDLPAVAAPRIPPPHERPPEERRRPAIAGWTIVEYDRDAIRRDLLPRLAEMEFGPDSGLECDLIVVNETSGEILFRSNDGLTMESFERADASAPLFDIHPGQFMHRAAGPMHHDPGPPPGMAGMGPRGPWRLLVKGRWGGLEALIAHTKMHNLLLSTLILALIAGVTALLVLATRRAQELARTQMEFVAGVSHELRTPLSVIGSAAQNLADGVVTREDQVRRYGSVIAGEGRRLTNIVEQILRFAGIQSGRASYGFEPVDVSALITNAVTATQPEIARAGMRVETAIAPGVPSVHADAVALSQCVRNLIDNAVTHASGGGYLKIGAAALGGSVEIFVEDAGAGVDETDLPRLFEPFYRGRRALRDQIHGFGLGLALVSRIVEAHSGSVSVVNLPERGARFAIRLPAAPPASAIEKETAYTRS